jgi:CO/xanthine dehydrogenase FAD-binding subunit
LVQSIGKILASGFPDVELGRMVEEKIKLALKPIDDIRASATYRLAMAKVLTLRAWRLVIMRLKNRMDGEISHAI